MTPHSAVSRPRQTRLSRAPLAACLIASYCHGITSGSGPTCGRSGLTGASWTSPQSTDTKAQCLLPVRGRQERLPTVQRTPFRRPHITLYHRRTGAACPFDVDGTETRSTTPPSFRLEQEPRNWHAASTPGLLYTGDPSTVLLRLPLYSTTTTPRPNFDAC